MPFTFECGVCHAAYRLDESQISAGGIKVTCPTCLNYFFLKRDSSAAEAPAVIEHIVQDGAKELKAPPPSAAETTADQLLTDRDLEEPASVSPTVHISAVPKEELIAPPRPGPWPPASAGQPTSPPTRTPDRPTPAPRVTTRDAEPRDASGREFDSAEFVPAPGALEQYLVPLSLIAMVVAGLLYLNHRGIIRIPGLEMLQAVRTSGTPPAAPSESAPALPTPAGQPRHGFPVMDPAHNSWENPPAPPAAGEAPETK